MNVTIVGAGNVGTQFAVHCAETGHRVTLFGSKPHLIQHELSIVDENGIEIHRGSIEMATSDAEVAFSKADIIFVVMPATMMQINATKIEPYARPGMRIGLVPGTGGGECAFRGCIEKGATVFGVQRVPSVARLTEYGKTVRAVGYRGEMYVSAIPNSDTSHCCRLIESLFGIKTSALPNYLNITLTPSNPILHTTRLRNLFGDWHDGMVYERVPLFYEDWNDETSKLLFACDDEVQSLCRNLSEFDLSFVKSLKTHYESSTPEALTKKIASIAGFKGLTSPMIQVDGGFVPDFNSRYFTADFSYGLAILMQIAEFVGLDVPNMKATLEWYYGLVGKRNEYCFSDYGIMNRNDLTAFYSM